jgi:alginate O-acetyltransferase complex protein AlgI
MSLVSLQFALFFTVVLIVYYAIPHRFRWGWLLFAGYVFYASWNLLYVPLLLFVTLLFYWTGQRIRTTEDANRRRTYLIFGVAISLAILFLFQYVNFFTASQVVSLAVPIGISFYTFMGIGYLVDTFRTPPLDLIERGSGGEDFRFFALFIAFFPTLTSGPIERARHLIPQFESQKTFDEPRTIAALRLILWGVFKKLVIADRLAIYVNAVYDQPQEHTGITLILATVFYAFQIYADFSAYTDVAVGVAKLLGFDLIENFRQSYFAQSVRDFWQRWHISLSTWIRDYMFMPLSRNSLRRTKGKYPRLIQGLSNLIVMVLVGLWHGPSWTFVIWGALHGLYLSVESMMGARVKVLKPTTTRDRVIVGARVLFTFVLVTFAWIFFRASSLDDAGYILTHLFDFNTGLQSVTAPFSAGVLGAEREFLLSIGLIGLLLFIDWIDANRGWLNALGGQRTPVRWAVYYALGAAILFSTIYGFNAQEFIYFQF